MIWVEFAVQLPCILVLLYGYARRAQWMRTAGLMYGVHVATTMIPLFGHFLGSDNPHKASVLAIYMPWFIMPVIMAVRFALVGWQHPFAYCIAPKPQNFKQQ